MGSVTRRFPKKNLVPLGGLPVERLGLSARRSSELLLHQAWERAAGERLAARAVPLTIRRGVLEMRMTTADAVWSRTLYELLPGLAASMLATRPRLGLRQVRLIALNGAPIGEDQALAADPLVESPSLAPQAVEPSRPLRLERLMRAYLSRSETSSTVD
jgi:hypothetical protein